MWFSRFLYVLRTGRRPPVGGVGAEADHGARRPFTIPRPNSPEFYPAMVCLTLVLAGALQLALPSTVDLPAQSGLAPRRARLAIIPRIGAFPAILARNVFSPEGGAGGAVSAGPDDLTVVGVVRAGRQAAILVKVGATPARLVRVGESLGGWRVAGLDRDAVLVSRDGIQRRLIVGAPARSPAPGPQAPEGAETAQ